MARLVVHALPLYTLDLTKMLVLLEKFVLPILAACVVTVIFINPLKLDWPQRISLLIAVLALAYFAGHTLSKRTVAQVPQQSTTAPTPTSITGAATSSGSESPAITGSNVTVNYGDPVPQQKPKKSQ